MIGDAPCTFHPALPAERPCDRCERPICDACTNTLSDGAMVCPGCFTQHLDRRSKKKTLLYVASGAGVMALIIALLLLRSSHASHPPHNPLLGDYDYGPWEKRLDNLATIFEADPCQTRTTIELAEGLGRAGNYRGTIAVVNRAVKSCPHDSRLTWPAIPAHEQLGEWDQALKLTDALVKERPTDSDFWSWRGADHIGLKQVDAARADIRQALAGRAGRKDTARLIDISPCEGALAALYYAEQSTTADWAAEQGKKLMREHDCGHLLGKGSAKIDRATGDDAPPLKAKAAIGGTPVSMRVDPDAGTTVLTAAAAQRLGLTAGAGTLEVRVGEQLVTGHPVALAVVSIGEATAANVDAVIVDTLPGNGEPVDGVIGFDFLWRFAFSADSDGVVMYELPG